MRILIVALVVVGFSLSVYSIWQPTRTVTGSTAAESRSPDPAVIRVETVLAELEANGGQGSVPGKAYRLLEPDLNAYLAFKLRVNGSKTVEAISVKLDEGVFTTRMLVNMDELNVQRSSSLGLLGMLLTGTQVLEVDGQLAAQDGKATYRVQSARLNNISVPGTLVEMLLSNLGRRHDPPFDPTQPFEMPYSIQEVRVQSGRVTLLT